MNSTHYAEKAQEHNDITAASAVLADARRVEGVQGGHYRTEFDDEGYADGDTITVRVSAEVYEDDETDLDDVQADLGQVGEVEVVETDEKSGFRAHVDNSGTFAQPGTRVPNSTWTKHYATFDVTVRLRETVVADGGQVQENSPECEDCGTTENVQELTDPEFGGVVGYACEDCIAENVAEIEAELDEEARQEAEEAEVKTSRDRKHMSPKASHVLRVVEEAYEDFILNHYSYGFADTPKVWNEGDYADGAGVVLTCGFRDEEVRSAFLHGDGEDYYENKPEGVEARLKWDDAYIEWENGYTFVLVE